MAISGILVHCLEDDLEVVEQQVSSMEELTTYGIHEGAYVVAVVESPSDVIEKVVKRIGRLDGVLTVYTTYLTIEDEIDDDGNLTTNLSATQHMKMEPRQDG
ncbi:MAG: chaperone NapD [Desulfocapsa sp.]|uniref:Chaperone NapD n=1 Tax=Desulfotalea psychrophila TaxID=84980 RepID=A0ABS3AWI2_9BACT|nr:chaperone NapD [Desulfocapsa sp.]MBN4068910.1 chaperone NapD [Desulfotalea psychrophila]